MSAHAVQLSARPITSLKLGGETAPSVPRFLRTLYSFLFRVQLEASQPAGHAKYCAAEIFMLRASQGHARLKSTGSNVMHDRQFNLSLPEAKNDPSAIQFSSPELSMSTRLGIDSSVCFHP